MVIESVQHSHVRREPQVQPQLDQSEVVEALRHGNIYDILRTPGVNRNDVEQFLAAQWQRYHNQLIQDYEVYAPPMTIPPPQEIHIPDMNPSMAFSQQDRRYFQQEMKAYQAARVHEVAPPPSRVRALGSVRAQGALLDYGSGPGQDVIGIGEKALMEWDDFFGELQMKMIDTQMFQNLQQRSQELQKEVDRILSLVMAGVVDPEYLIIAATKATMVPNGVFFRGTAEKIMHINENMNNIAKEIYSMDASDPNYMKELQMAQSRTRAGSSDMQLQMMNIQKFAGNIATALDFGMNTVRRMEEMRRTTMQNIAAR